MSEAELEVKMRRWVSNLMWLRYRGRRWRVSDSGGGMCSVEFNRKEEKKWFDEIPSEHHAAVKVITEKNEERLKLLEKKTKKGYGYHMMYEKILL